MWDPVYSNITKSKVKQNNMFSSAFEMLNNFKGTSWNVKVHYQQKRRFQVFVHWVNRDVRADYFSDMPTEDFKENILGWVPSVLVN